MRRAINLVTASLCIALLAAGSSLSGCGSDGAASVGPPRNQNPPPDELRSSRPRLMSPIVNGTDSSTFASDNLAFSVDMYQALRSDNPGNFVYSQTSISTALAMLYAGAANNTATQMAHTLHFSLPGPQLHAGFNALDLALTTPPPGANAAAFRIEIANSVWLQDGMHVQPAYLDTLAENYGAGLFIEDFIKAPETARESINAWVSDQTERQIPTLFPEGSIDNLTRLVLANAVFFHGDWKVPFAKDSPNGIFHALSGDVTVPTMHGSFNTKLWSGPGWNAGVLDYVGDSTSMIIVVPDAGTFSAFEADMTADSLMPILAGAATAPGGADLHMPRFKFTTELLLNNTLASMGMPDAFGDAADFSGIDGARDLHLQTVVHKAIIAVDEKGTTASAATGAGGGVTSVPPALFVDRPFLFFIRHNPTGAILFQGRVVDPSK